MPQNSVTILSTKAIDQTLIEEAARKNIIVDIESFITTEPVSSIEVQQEIEQALLLTTPVVFTSKKAVEAVVAEMEGHIPDWQIFCIGHTTLHLVEKYFGKELIAGIADNALDLAEVIIDYGEAESVVFFCGDQSRKELPETLRRNNIEVDEIIVYQTVAVPHAVQKKYDGILFFSPTAVSSFFQSNHLEERTVLFAIGHTTAGQIKKLCKNKVLVSDQPTSQKLLEKAILFFETNPIHH